MSRDRTTTVLEIVGLLVVALGAALIYIPAGVVMLGAALVLIGWAEGAK